MSGWIELIGQTLMWIKKLLSKEEKPQPLPNKEMRKARSIGRRQKLELLKTKYDKKIKEAQKKKKLS